MKKEYKSPELTLVTISLQDVVLVSGPEYNNSHIDDENDDWGDDWLKVFYKDNKTKKYLKTTLFLIIIISLTVLSAISVSSAENYIVLYGFAFDINTDGEAVIHGYDDRSADVVIPKKLMGADVTLIDDYAFFGDGAITSLSFNNAEKLKKIGSNAFFGCTGLKSIEIPSWIE